METNKAGDIGDAARAEKANDLAKYGIGNKLSDGSPFLPDGGFGEVMVAADAHPGRYTVSVDFGRVLSGEEQERFMNHVMGWRP